MLKQPAVVEAAEQQGHAGCHDQPCHQCAAEKHLHPEDWEAVKFYGRVSDQVMPLNPMGDKEGYTHPAPRLEGWLAVLTAYDYPRWQWPRLISAGRRLFDLMHDGERTPGLYQMSLEELGVRDG